MRRMKNNTSKVFIIVVILIVAVLVIFQMNGKKDTNQTAETAIATLQTIVDSDSYSVEVIDENGETHVLEDTNKTRLAEIITSTIQTTQESDFTVSGPQISVRIYTDDPASEVVLVVYDIGEETNMGTLQSGGQEYFVQNCGEVLNYLAEIGFLTQR